MIECNKQQKHSSFIPVDILSKEHLPDSLSDDTEILDFIRCMADLTVRIRVNLPSSHSKNNSKSDIKSRNGTGWVNCISENGERGDCPCHSPSKPFKPRRWWKMSIVTAQHVVYDEKEAESTIVELFYDDHRGENGMIDEKRRKVSKMDHVRIISADHDLDLTILTCVTHDRNIFKSVKKALALVKERSSRIAGQPRTGYRTWGIVNFSRFSSFVRRKDDQKVRSLDSTLVFIVSHPHGLPKKISVGTLTGKYPKRRSSLRHGNSLAATKLGVDQAWQQDTFDRVAPTKVEILWRPAYTAATCPGSSGAPVFIMPSTGLSPRKNNMVRWKRNIDRGTSDRDSQLFYTHSSWISGQSELADMCSLDCLSVSLKDLGKEADMDNVSVEVWFPKGEKKMCEIHFHTRKVKEEKERLLGLGEENYDPPENYCLVLSTFDDSHQDIVMIDDDEILHYVENIADAAFVLKFVKTGDLDVATGATPLGVTLKQQ